MWLTLSPFAEFVSMETELEDLIDQANRGEAPSPFGKMEFVVHGAPSSIQAKKEKRDEYIASIKKQLNSYQFILTGEIILNITWLIPTKSRYETDGSADIDNCIKPIIDALTGKDGLFVDDCQIRGLYICWRHITSEDERLIFELEFDADSFSQKSKLAFVQLDKGLCTPVNIDWPKSARVLWGSYLKSTKAFKDALERLGVDYPAVAGFLGNSRPFHATRIKGFRKLTIDEFMA
jgi:Holliday junction resolvase RusA-like endonuclease